MTKLEELKKRHAELREQITEESKAAFKEMSAGIFAEFPAVERFSWTQYTPYFNDGDECTFSVNSDPKINDVDCYDSDEDKKGIPDGAFKSVRKLIESIDEPAMKEMFGDHCKVIVTREGVTVEEYSHD